MIRVAEIMQSHVVTVHYEETVSDLARILNEKGISGVPVVDADGTLLGVVSRTDIGTGLCDPPLPTEEDREPGEYYDRLDGPAGRRHLGEARVADIMTQHVVTVEPDTSVLQLIETMDESGIHRVFVTQGGELVGVVSTTDLVHLLKRLLKGRAAASLA